MTLATPSPDERSGFLCSLNEHLPEARKRLWDLARARGCVTDAEIREWARTWNLGSAGLAWFHAKAKQEADAMPRFDCAGSWTEYGFVDSHGWTLQLRWNAGHESLRAFQLRAKKELASHIARVEQWARERGISVDDRDREIPAGLRWDALVLRACRAMQYPAIVKYLAEHDCHVTPSAVRNCVRRCAERIGMDGSAIKAPRPKCARRGTA